MVQCRCERHTHTDWSIEGRDFKTREVTIEAEVLCRDDGFKLIRLGKKWRYDGYFDTRRAAFPAGFVPSQATISTRHP